MQAYGFANRCLSEITAEMLSSDDLVKFLYYTDNAEEDFLQKPRTYNMILLTLNQIFEFAIDEDFCTKNIVRKIKPLWMQQN